MIHIKFMQLINEAMKTKGKPTVILAKTIKGYGMGKSGESINITHQQKKLGEEICFIIEIVLIFLLPTNK